MIRGLTHAHVCAHASPVDFGLPDLNPALNRLSDFSQGGETSTEKAQGRFNRVESFPYRDGAMRLLSTASMCCAAALLCCQLAFAANPRFGGVSPIGAQRGTELDVILRGDQLDDAEELLLYEPGIEVTHFERVTNEDERKRGDRIKVHLKIDPQCRLGAHRFRIRTRTGLSRVVYFHVGTLPIVDEVEPNTDFATPQEIGLNVSVSGKILPEDVDYYVVEAKKGERITAEIFGQRFGASTGNRYFDPYLAILNSERFELAVADDTPLLFNDAVVSIIAPEDGKYYIQVRDASYNGDGNSHYLLHVGTFPRPLAVIPSGGRPGQTLDVTFLGDVKGPITRTVTLPNEVPEDGFALEVSDEGGEAPSPVPFRLADLDNVIETEGNHSFETATPGTSNCAFNGVIAEPGKSDFFRFSGTKGQHIQFEAYARRIRSGLDTVIALYNAKDGKLIKADDDTRRPDSAMSVDLPEDGEYILEVRDHLRNGSPTFTYRVELTGRTPSLVATPREFERYIAPVLVVPQGGGVGIVATVTRSNVGGPVNFRSVDLPPGVRMEVPADWRGDTNIPIAFYADEDAPIGGKYSTIEAFLDDPAQPDLKVVGRLEQKIIMIRARNNDRVQDDYLLRLPVVVAEKAPFKCWIEVPPVPLVTNGSMNLKIRCEKAEGWDEEIRLIMLQNPPGITSNGSAVIPKGATEAEMLVSAANNATIRECMIAIRCRSKFAGGDYESLTPAVPLKVTNRYVDFEFAQGAVEQGKEIAYLIKVNKSKDFEGEAEVELVGLPAHATAEKVKLTKDMEELQFVIKAAPETPVGVTTGLRCVVMIPENGSFIRHNLGDGRLRVDKPAPPPKEMAAAEAKPAETPKQEAPPKPLTRLQQLRLQQQNAGAGGGE